MNMDSLYAVPAGIHFRQEEFGGIVYRHRDDLLFFLNSPLTMRMLELAGTGTVREIAARIKPGVADDQAVREHVLKVLCSLKELGIIYEHAN